MSLEDEYADAQVHPGADRAPGFCRACGNDLGGRILFCAACHKPVRPRVGMEKGGPYSPALYEATAPLRRAQKMEVERMKDMQVHDATWRHRDTLKAVRADLEADERSRQSAVDDWNDRESQATEDIDAAEKALRATEKSLPAAENALRGAKRTVIQSENNLDTAIKNLATAEKRVSAAESDLYAAERAEEEARSQVSSAELDLDSASAAVPPAQRDVDAAESEARSADSALGDARVELFSAQSRLDTVQSRLSAAESRLSAAESRLDSARDTLRNAESDLSYAQNKSDHDAARDAQSRVYAAQNEVNSAQNEVNSAEGKVGSAQSDMHYPRSEVSSAQRSVDSAKHDVDRAQNALSAARDILRRAQERVSAAQDALSEARSALTAAQHRTAAAQSELDDAKNNERATRDQKKDAERDLAAAQKELAAAQRGMPSAEVLLSAERDLAEAEAESRAAGRRAERARERVTAAQKKEQAAGHLREVEGLHQNAEEARWAAEQDAVLSLEQYVKDGEQWAAKPLRAAMDLRKAEEELRAVRMERADAVLSEAKDSVQLAQRWMSEDQTALEAAEKRQAVAQMWVDDARGEQWTDKGKRWTKIQQKALAVEQKAAEALRCIRDGWAENRTEWVAGAERDVERWTTFADERAAEEEQDDMRRRRDADNIRHTDRRFGAILESLEKIPEMGRTGDNIDLYRDGVEAAKSYHLILKAGIRWPASLDHLRSMAPDLHRRLAAMAAEGSDDTIYERIRERLSGEGMPNAAFRELFEDPRGGGYAVRPWEGEGGIEETLKRLGGVHYDHGRDVEFAREHSEAAQAISTGQMSGEALDALDKAIERIYGSLDEISRDGEVGATPTMDRRTLFEGGVLMLTDSRLVLYDERGLEERESIPLDSVRKCGTDRWWWWLGRPSSLNVQYGDDQRRSFRLPKGFSAAHSASEEYSIWDYMVNRRLKLAGKGSAVLHVHTEPPGAVVLVDGVPYGTAPLTLVKPLRTESILSKRYKVQAHLEGYEPRTKDAPTKVKDSLDKLDIQLKPRKRADRVADKELKGYRRQLPELPEHEQFVREHVLEGEHGTLVLSRDSVIVLSTCKRTLLRVPYGALEKVEKTKIGRDVQGLTISYRQEGGFKDGVYFAMDRSKNGDRDAAYREVERLLNGKKKEWSGRGSCTASGLTRLPRSGYTTITLADVAPASEDGGGR